MILLPGLEKSMQNIAVLVAWRHDQLKREDLEKQIPDGCRTWTNSRNTSKQRTTPEHIHVVPSFVVLSESGCPFYLSLQIEPWTHHPPSINLPPTMAFQSIVTTVHTALRTWGVALCLSTYLFHRKLSIFSFHSSLTSPSLL